MNPSGKVHETEVMLENRKYYYLRSVKTTKLNEYSRKCKRPPKMQKLSGLLQEVFLYKKCTTGGSLPRRGPGTYIYMEDNLLQAQAAQT